MMPHALSGHLPAGPLAVRLLAYGLALALTLALAARLTPRHWWRRPTARGAAVLAGGTLALGTLFLAIGLAFAGRPPPEQTAVSIAEPAPPASEASPAAGATYRVLEQLNLRAGRGVHTARLAVLPAGSRVVATGARDGDWWEVGTRVDGRTLTGWTSSLWLRRGEEVR